MPPPPVTYHVAGSTPPAAGTIVPASDTTLDRTLIAIPVHNEVKYLRNVLDRVRRYHDDVLCIDDGSTDGSGEILQELADAGDIQLIAQATNQGYGRALIDAFDHAHARGYEWIVTMDCDEQHDPALLPEFFKAIARDDADIVSGSRYLASFDGDDLPPKERRRINCTLTTLLNDVFDEELTEKLTDSFCGYKAHRVGPTANLDLDEAGYAFPMQLWPRAIDAGLRIREIPVHLIYNDAARTFGNGLDDSDRRLKHYLAVLDEELERTDRPGVGWNVAQDIAEAGGCQ
jgi:dolichol-phosphate mannosyltransferase